MTHSNGRGQRIKFRLFGQGDVSLYSPSKSIDFKVTQSALGAWILACLGCLSAYAQAEFPRPNLSPG